MLTVVYDKLSKVTIKLLLHLVKKNGNIIRLEY